MGAKAILSDLKKFFSTAKEYEYLFESTPSELVIERPLRKKDLSPEAITSYMGALVNVRNEQFVVVDSYISSCGQDLILRVRKKEFIVEWN